MAPRPDSRHPAPRLRVAIRTLTRIAAVLGAHRDRAVGYASCSTAPSSRSWAGPPRPDVAAARCATPCCWWSTRGSGGGMRGGARRGPSGRPIAYGRRRRCGRSRRRRGGDSGHCAMPRVRSWRGCRRRGARCRSIEDGCVPVECLADYLHLLRSGGPPRGRVVVFGHAGDGHVHVNLLPDTTRPGWKRRVAALLDEVTAASSRWAARRRASMATGGSAPGCWSGSTGRRSVASSGG